MNHRGIDLLQKFHLVDGWSYLGSVESSGVSGVCQASKIMNWRGSAWKRWFALQHGMV